MTTSIKKALRSIYLACLHFIGRIRYKSRMVPQFIIIGTQKGGTSSLFYYLKTHPQIKRSIKKETHYFNKFYENGQKWYLAHFPAKSKSYITGEATPDYLFHPDTPGRIKNLNPDIKLIVLLRNPIERAYSAYQMNRRFTIDPHETFEEAVNFELNHADNNTSEYTHDKHHFFYLKRGKYSEQLSKWLVHFSKSQFLVINSHNLFNNTNETISKVHRFLEIDNVLPSSLKPMNVATYPPLSKELYSSLASYFKEDLQSLKNNWSVELQLV